MNTSCENPQQYKGIYEIIHQAYPSWYIHTASNLEEAQLLLKQSVENQHYYSMFLLDIQLSDNTLDVGGFEFAKQIREQPIYYKTPILFLTSIYGRAGFALSNFHCYDYITKPYSASDLLFEIKQMLLTRFLAVHSVMITDVKRITHRIILSDITYIEAKSHLIIIHTTNDIVSSRKDSFASLQDSLTDSFIQCHRKYIINAKHLKTYDKKNQYIQVGSDTLPVSRGYQDDFEAHLNEYRPSNGE